MIIRHILPKIDSLGYIV